MSRFEALLERTLCLLLPYRDIVKTVDGEKKLYLRRFFLKHHRKGDGNGDSGGVFLHVIHRSDDDPDPHDHPWDFTTFVLARGYTDWSSRWSLNLKRRLPFGVERVGPWRIVRRSAEHIHRVVLVGKRPAWTLVFTGPVVQEWGFWRRDGKVGWRKYLGIDDGEW